MYPNKKRKVEEGKEAENEGEKMVKSVRFTPDTKKENLNFKRLYKKGKYHIQSFKNLWLKFAYEKEFKQLKQALVSYQKRRNFSVFFESYGDLILRCAFFSTHKPDQLNFICENLPKELIQATLSEKDYSLIDLFLSAESALDSLAIIDNERMMDCIEKIRLLLTIAPEAIKERLAANLQKDSISPRVKASISQVLQEALATPSSSAFLGFAFGYANETFTLPPTPPLANCEETPALVSPTLNNRA